MGINGSDSPLRRIRIGGFAPARDDFQPFCVVWGGVKQRVGRPDGCCPYRDSRPRSIGNLGFAIVSPRHHGFVEHICRLAVLALCAKA
jgi:hypothetical protein